MPSYVFLYICTCMYVQYQGLSPINMDNDNDNDNDIKKKTFHKPFFLFFFYLKARLKRKEN